MQKPSNIKVKTIKNSIAQIAPHYTMKRQLDDYYSKFYTKEAKRFQMLSANDNAKAKEIAAWKEEVVEKWDSIEVVSCEKTEELVKGSIESGKEYTITYVIDEKGLNDAVGLELVTTYTTADGKQHVYSVEPFSVIKKEGGLSARPVSVRYTADFHEISAEPNTPRFILRLPLHPCMMQAHKTNKP